MNQDTCTVTGCEKPVKRYEMCYGHYMKNWRYGTPEPEHPSRREDLRGKRFGTLVVVEPVGHRWRCACDCGAERVAAVGELHRAGDANTCGDRATHHRREDAGYAAAHQRVRRDRGHIGSHSCVDCGAPARHWSYNHEDPEQLLANGLSARPVAYSLCPDFYDPRCVPCHKRFDLGRIDALPFAG